MRISVVGGGRMGLPLACTFGKNGATVTVCDINGTLVDTINAGRSPFEEPGLDELVAALHADRRISATLDTAGATSRSARRRPGPRDGRTLLHLCMTETLVTLC